MGALDEGGVAEVRPEVVSHQAAQASVNGSMADPLRDASINVLGSLNVLEAARKHGVRKLIYTSTPSVVYQRRSSVAGPCDTSAFAT